MKNFNDYMTDIKKSIASNAQLDYFKMKLIAILDKHDNYDPEISKAIEYYDKKMQKSLLDEFGIEKGRGYGIGTVREWKGHKYKKIAPNKWRRIYEHETRGAQQSIRILKNKIANAQSIDELMQLVMENVGRFQDQNGKLLPIVSELQKAVNESKGKLNAGKLSTQEQIEAAKKAKERFVPPFLLTAGGSNPHEKAFSSVRAEKLKVGDYFLPSSWSDNKRPVLRVTDIQVSTFMDEKVYTITDQYGQKHEYKYRTSGGPLISKLNDDYEFEYNDSYKYTDEYNEIIQMENNKEKYDKLKKLQDKIKPYFEDLLKRYQNRWNEDLNGDEMDELQDKYRRIRNIWDSLDSDIRNLYWDLPEQKEAKENEEKKVVDIYDYYKSLKKELNNIEDLDQRHKERKEFIKSLQGALVEYTAVRNEKPVKLRYIYNGLIYDIERMIERCKKEDKNEAPNRPSVLKNQEIMFTKKTYSDEEKKEANEKLNKLEIENLKNAIEYKSLKNDVVELSRQYLRSRGSRPNNNSTDEISKEIREKNDRCDELYKKIKANSDEIDKHLEVVLDDIINAEFKNDPAVDTMNASEIQEYMNKKMFFDKENNVTNLDGVDDNSARTIFKMYEKLYSIMHLRGVMQGIQSKSLDKNTFAQVSYLRKSVEINNKWFNNFENLDKEYKNCVDTGFHPKGDGAGDIIIHENTHAMINLMKGIRNYTEPEKAIKEKVLKNFKIKGLSRDETIKKFVSGYGTKNNDEFVAEAFTRGIMGDKNNLCRAVVKEFIKAINYQGGIFVS